MAGGSPTRLSLQPGEGRGKPLEPRSTGPVVVTNLDGGLCYNDDWYGKFIGIYWEGALLSKEIIVREREKVNTLLTRRN